MNLKFLLLVKNIQNFLFCYWPTLNLWEATLSSALGAQISMQARGLVGTPARETTDPFFGTPPHKTSAPVLWTPTCKTSAPVL